MFRSGIAVVANDVRDVIRNDPTSAKGSTIPLE
jgi:hypothetical protein